MGFCPLSDERGLAGNVQLKSEAGPCYRSISFQVNYQAREGGINDIMSLLSPTTTLLQQGSYEHHL